MCCGFFVAIYYLFEHRTMRTFTVLQATLSAIKLDFDSRSDRLSSHSPLCSSSLVTETTHGVLQILHLLRNGWKQHGHLTDVFAEWWLGKSGVEPGT